MYTFSYREFGVIQVFLQHSGNSPFSLTYVYIGFGK